MRSMLSGLQARLANRPRERSNAYVVEFRRIQLAGDYYYVPEYALHRPACRKFLSGRVHEPETHALVARLLAERRGDLIHAGTFFGDMLPSFARACRGTVYAFEPVLENYVLAKLCLERNGIRNVALFNAGLCDHLTIGHVNIGSAVHRGGTSQIAESGQTTTMMRIDDLNLRNVIVLQLDVEGHELPALKGAERTIARCKPVILIEDNNRACADFLHSRSYERSGEVPGLEIWTEKTRSGLPLT